MIPTVNSTTATTMRRAPTAVTDPAIAAVLLSAAAHDRIFSFHYAL